MSPMEREFSLPRAAPQTGALLVATPALQDPNFAQTVLLILDAGADGAMGVVLNRPSTVEVGQVLPEWQAVVDQPQVLFVGGPVATDSALGIGLLAPGGHHEGAGWRQLSGPIGLVDLDSPVGVLAESTRGLRIFAGYAGWGVGQLEEEIAEGAWYVVPGEPDDVFADPDAIWGRVLGRQRGALAMLSTFPIDTSAN